MSRDLLNIAQVAKIIRHSPEWFSRHRKRLEEEHGFPKSVAGMGKRWDPRAIEIWQDWQLPPAASASGLAQEDAALADARRELERRLQPQPALGAQLKVVSSR
jgi:hypothetical protein